MMEHGDAIRAVYDLEKKLERKDKLLERLRAKDLRLRNTLRDLRAELAEAKNNIGELNSMLARKEQVLASVRRAHENQALTIANQNQELTARVLSEASLHGMINDLRREVEELREDERCDCAPNLALAACKKKLEQLEGMLEGQRRNTRELGVTLQRVRDERTAFKNQAEELQERLDATKENWMSRHSQALTERDDYLKQLQDLQKRKDRALSLVRRAATILDPPTVTETWDGDTRITSSWDSETGMQGVTVTPQAKKATPRTDLHRCGGLNGHHRCQNMYLPGQLAHPQRHHCHCGFTWPW